LATATRGPSNNLNPFSSTNASNNPTSLIAQGNPVVERALTQNEISFLQSILKKGAVPALRVLGALSGFSAIMLVIGGAAGLPVDPGTYTPLVMITGILGMVLGGASQSIRYPVRRALAKGTAHEVYGVPEIGTGNSRSVPVSLAGLSFQLRPSQVARLLPGRMNKMAFAEAGPAGRKGSKSGLSTALVLEWNGNVVARRETLQLLNAGPLTGPRNWGK
jgi:hypothetical protein